MPSDDQPTNEPPRMGDQQDRYELDPVFVNSKREARVILLIFGLFALHTLGFCYLFGGLPTMEGRVAESSVWGIPLWVFWGIFVPWFGAVLVTGWFCFAFMQDDNLAPEAIPGPENEEHIKPPEHNTGKDRSQHRAQEQAPSDNLTDRENHTDLGDDRE